MVNYFILNRETSKIELHFDRATYNALPADKKAAIKSTFLWSRSAGAWVSRSTQNHWRALDVAKGLGLENHGEEGERLSFAEQQEQKAERADARADRMEGRAQKAAGEAHARFNSPNIETVRGLQGQPILVGHHSEKRHRRLLERADNDMRKGCEAYDKSKHYEQRADAARRTASQAQLSNPGFLDRRIKEGEAEERKLMRLVEAAVGKDDPDWLDRLHPFLESVRDKLAFYREHLAGLGGLKYSKANVKAGDWVRIRGDWHEVVRANPTTVSVPNTCYPDVAAQRKWPLKYGWGEVRDHWTKEVVAARLAAIHDTPAPE